MTAALTTGYAVISDRTGKICSGVVATYEKAAYFISDEDGVIDIPGFTVRAVYEGMVVGDFYRGD